MMNGVNTIFGICLILVGIVQIIEHVTLGSNSTPVNGEGTHGLILAGIGLVLLNQARKT